MREVVPRVPAVIAGILLRLVLYVCYVFLLFIGGSMVAALIGGPVVRVLANTLVGIVANPIAALTELVLYYDARIRAEGFDLDQLADALDAPASHASP